MWLDLVYLNLFLMLSSWLIVTYNQRAGLVDVTWSLCIAINAIFLAVTLNQAPLMIRCFIGLASGLWFLRLFWHLLRRYLSETEEDTRYATMRRAMGRWQHVGFFAFFMFQAALALLFAYPMLNILTIPQSQWGSFSSLALTVSAAVMLVAFMGEVIADQQLYDFKKQPENQGLTMDQGLWKYSRHPNYFFEWLHWFAYPILALAAGQYILWIYPVLMWFFLHYITGIPFSEQQALRHRGENYQHYQQRTSMFIPWPPKQ